MGKIKFKVILDFDMEGEHKFGKMDQYMKDIGTRMLLVGKEGWFMQMEINMRENGEMTKHMDL